MIVIFKSKVEVIMIKINDKSI